MLKLLLGRSFCVGALARRLELTEAAISQHLKVLREAGLVNGEKRGYFVHYDVDRERLRSLSKEICMLAEIERESCEPEREECVARRGKICRAQGSSKKHADKDRECNGKDAGAIKLEVTESE